MTKRLAVCLAALLGGAACSNEEGERVDPESVVYEGSATDEAWVVIEEAPRIVDEVAAPSLTAPTSNVASDGDAPTFEWTGGAVVAIRTPEKQIPSDSSRGLSMSEVARWVFNPISVARAHLEPYTGAIYRLALTPHAGPSVHVLTSRTSYTPSSEVWNNLRTHTGVLSIDLAAAYMETGRIEEGPYVHSSPITIEIE